jgi:pentatricopeptide repeat protein
MTQKQKQRATWNQINQIERAVRLLDRMMVSGLYLDQKQKRQLINISHFTKRLTDDTLMF